MSKEGLDNGILTHLLVALARNTKVSPKQMAEVTADFSGEVLYLAEFTKELAKVMTDKKSEEINKRVAEIDELAQKIIKKRK